MDGLTTAKSTKVSPLKCLAIYGSMLNKQVFNYTYFILIFMLVDLIYTVY